MNRRRCAGAPGKPPEGKLDAARLSRRRAGQHRNRRRRRGHRRRPGQTQRPSKKGLLRPEQAEKLSDREALNLIFQAGFSTAQTVTNVSGRGVGMDVVKSHIEKIGGVVDLTQPSRRRRDGQDQDSSHAGHHSGLGHHQRQSTLRAAGAGSGERFVIPQVSLVELIRLEDQIASCQIELIHGTPVYRRRGSLLPIAYLNRGARI